MRIWIKTIMAIVNIKIIFWISGSEEYHRKYSCYHDPSLNPISWEGRSSHFHCQEHIPLTFFFYIFFRKYIFMWFVNIRRNEWTDSKVKISLSWRWWNVGDERNKIFRLFDNKCVQKHFIHVDTNPKQTGSLCIKHICNWF